MKDRKYPSKAAAEENETKKAQKFALIQKVHKAPTQNKPKADNTKRADKKDLARNINIQKIFIWLHAAPELKMG